MSKEIPENIRDLIKLRLFEKFDGVSMRTGDRFCRDGAVPVFSSVPEELLDSSVPKFIGGKRIFVVYTGPSGAEPCLPGH